jgi:hypothetical protein
VVGDAAAAAVAGFSSRFALNDAGPKFTAAPAAGTSIFADRRMPWATKRRRRFDRPMAVEIAASESETPTAIDAFVRRRWRRLIEGQVKPPQIDLSEQ